ncbi:hypothetical protein EGR_10537 [Echinococcus granulosus]|uniref:Uncharacterized protein n=1 Tax=Echinococcus granulosus TaxID=6210 RepID=W6UM80_ECHGR|nr:hypothetical protein EGR_10537 [Echinococcus granulosus]EUB54599.1 hypothetical protein EGR_10537 [Echinococcus granulosus]
MCSVPLSAIPQHKAVCFVLVCCSKHGETAAASRDASATPPHQPRDERTIHGVLVITWQGSIQAAKEQCMTRSPRQVAAAYINCNGEIKTGGEQIGVTRHECTGGDELQRLANASPLSSSTMQKAVVGKPLLPNNSYVH